MLYLATRNIYFEEYTLCSLLFSLQLFSLSFFHSFFCAVLFLSLLPKFRFIVTLRVEENPYGILNVQMCHKWWTVETGIPQQVKRSEKSKAVTSLLLTMILSLSCWVQFLLGVRISCKNQKRKNRFTLRTYGNVNLW